MLESIQLILDKFTPIGLEQIDDVSLMSRMEVKYLLTNVQLHTILNQACKSYYILEIAGKRKLNYSTTYLDTPDFEMYMAHHNNRSNRYKIRTRTYLDSNTSYLEYKNKTSPVFTLKERIRLKSNKLQNNSSEKKFIDKCTPFQLAELEPKLISEYIRITLVDKLKTERITIDLNLKFSHENESISLSNTVIAEIKRSEVSEVSEFIKLLRKEKIRTNNISKYCIGIALLIKTIKSNRFKSKLLMIKKLENDTYST